VSNQITLLVRRVIQADVQRVFDAWTRPELLVKWWGPRPVTCREAKVDLQVGGAYRIGNLLPDGSVLFIFGEFEVVEPPRRLIYTWRIDQRSRPEAEESRVTVRFEPKGGQPSELVRYALSARAAPHAPQSFAFGVG